MYCGKNSGFEKNRSSRPGVLLEHPGKHPCRTAISIKLQSNFNEVTLRHGCSPANLLHIFRTPFPKMTSGRLLLEKRFENST